MHTYIHQLWSESETCWCFKIRDETAIINFLNWPSGAPLHTLSKLNGVPNGFVTNNHPPSYNSMYCFICGCQGVSVVRYWIICLVHERPRLHSCQIIPQLITPANERYHLRAVITLRGTRKQLFSHPNDPRSLNLLKIISWLVYLYFIYHDNCLN